MSGAIGTSGQPVLSVLDGGPLAYCLRQIEARLAIGFPDATFKRDRIPPTMSAELWREFSGRAPFVGVGWVSWPRAASAGARRYRGDAHFVVMLIAKNRRDWLMTGDRFSPGILGMATMAAMVLDGWTIDGIGACQVTEMGAVEAGEWVTDDIAICALRVRVEAVSLDDAGLQAQIAEFLQLGVSWDVGDTTTVDTVVQVRAE